MAYYVNRPSQLAYANSTQANDHNTGGLAGSSLGAAITSSGATITYQGGRWRFHRGATSSAARFNMPVDASIQYSVEVVFDLTDVITTESRLLMLMTGGTYAAHVAITASGALRIYNTANQNIYQTNTIPSGQFRLHIGVRNGETGTNDGSIRFNAYVGSNVQGSTPDYTFSSDTVSTGTALITELRMGHVNSLNGSHDISLVTIQADSTVITPLGALGSGNPIAQAGISSSSYALIDARTSISGGGTLSYSISPSSGVEQIATGWWAVPRAVSTVTYTVTVTDQSSNAQDQVEVEVEPDTGGTANDYTGFTQTVVFNGSNWQ